MGMIDEWRSKYRNAPAAQPAPVEAPGEMGYAEDAARSAASGGSRGWANYLGSLGSAGNMMTDLGSRYLQATGLTEDPEKARELANSLVPGIFHAPSQEQLLEAREPLQHKPNYLPGKIADRGGELSPSLAMPFGSMAGKAISWLGSSLGGPLAREGAEQFEATKPYADYADVGGTFLGGLLPSWITPNKIDEQRQKLVDLLEDDNVRLTAGQKTGNASLRAREAATGGSQYQQLLDEQADDFTSAALKKGGMDARSATPEVFNKQHAVLGAEFDRLQKYGAAIDTPLYEDLSKVKDEYYALTGGDRSGEVDRIINVITQKAGTGAQSLDGEWVKQQGTRLRDLIRRSSQTRPLQEALDGIREALDDAVERQISTVNPDDVGKFAQARTAYRNLLTLEEAAARSPAGNLTPAQLTAATKGMEGRRGYSRGFGPFNDLSRAGEQVITKVPTSGTSERLKALGGVLEPAALGALAGNAILPGGVGAFAGGVAGSGIKKVADALIMTPPVQAYLGNQLVDVTKGDAYRNALVNLLMQQNADRSK
jgi:hypothetical protein